MKSTTLTLMTTALALSVAAPSLAQQAATTRPAQTSRPDTPPPSSASGGTSAASRRASLPQGFSVVLVLGDIQGVSTSDDVPLAARKALTDMRDFLPFKSYKLLDAAWVLCCGQQTQHAGDRRTPEMLSQMLRGPDEQEYELKLTTSRAEGAQVFVKFSLAGSSSRDAAADSLSSTAYMRTTTRRIADLKDRRSLIERQIQEQRKKVDVGIAPGTDIPKLELELRQMDREIEDLTARLAEVSRRPTARPAVEQTRRSIIDTTFAMNVGETVVVGTSRLKGGSKALIALLTAVPPRSGERRE